MPPTGSPMVMVRSFVIHYVTSTMYATVRGDGGLLLLGVDPTVAAAGRSVGVRTCVPLGFRTGGETIE